MKKLMMNEKGMTAVEVLVCFILVVVITVSMYTTVSTYKNKQQIEAYKEQIYTYKNLLSKDINDDIVKTGLINAEITEFNTTGNEATGLNTYSANLYLRDGSVKTLKIKSIKAYDYLWDSSLESELPAANDQDDYFMIWYGDKGHEIMYPIPDLGESKNPNGKTIKDLRINNVEMKIQDSVFVIYIGFYHPDLGHRYAIDIVCPINYNGLSEDGRIDPVIPSPSQQLPDPSNPIEPSPSPIQPTLSPSPSSSPSPSPSPSSSPDPGDIRRDEACDRGVDSICWFTTMGGQSVSVFANNIVEGAMGDEWDVDVTIAWSPTVLPSMTYWQCWGTPFKTWPSAWHQNVNGSGSLGGFRCWQGTKCYDFLKSKQSADPSTPWKGGQIQRCDCWHGESC